MYLNTDNVHLVVNRFTFELYIEFWNSERNVVYIPPAIFIMYLNTDNVHLVVNRFTFELFIEFWNSERNVVYIPPAIFCV